MEPFLRKRLTFLSFFWDKIWPAGAPGFLDPDADLEPEPAGVEPPAAEPCSPPAPAQLFRALCDFRAQSAEELSVGRGDRLYALREQGGYIFARRLSRPPRTGLVPITCVTRVTPEAFSDQPWYFSGISRAEAQQLLLSPGNAPGAFLVRPSESSHGDFSLSVRAQAKVHHYRISTAADGSLYLQKGQLFPSLEELLAYYKVHWQLIQPCVPQDKWERPRSEFTLQRKLGEGYFGEVWEGLWLGSVPVAIKVIKPADMKLTDLAQEIRTLKSLRHQRLIRLHAVCSAGVPVYIVTELMRRGSLQAFLGSGRGHELPGGAAHRAPGPGCQERARGRRPGLQGGRLWPGPAAQGQGELWPWTTAGWLSGWEGRVPLCPLPGWSCLAQDDIYSPSCGSKIPVKWTAPEAAHYCVYSQKSDVWSFGVLLYEVFTYGQCPYEGMSNQETLQEIMRGYRLPRPAACPTEVYVLMLQCWRGSPEERPDFATLQEKLSAVGRRRHPALT